MGQQGAAHLDDLPGDRDAAPARPPHQPVAGLTRLRVATWNVHEAAPIDGATPHHPSSFWAPLVDAEVDVAALQEACFPASGELGDVALAAKFTGMQHVACFPLSASSFRAGESCGLALLSRYPLHDTRQEILPNPGLSREHDGAVVRSHDKGLLSAVLNLNQQPIRVVSLHITPFHRFGRVPQEFGSTWAALATLIDELDDLPLLIGGDFNTGQRELLTDQVDVRLHRAIGDQDTHYGKAADDILYADGFELVMSKVIGTRSDHALCLAEFEPPSGQ